jgi:hypothetical protein
MAETNTRNSKSGTNTSTNRGPTSRGKGNTAPRNPGKKSFGSPGIQGRSIPTRDPGKARQVKPISIQGSNLKSGKEFVNRQRPGPDFNRNREQQQYAAQRQRGVQVQKQIKLLDEIEFSQGYDEAIQRKIDSAETPEEIASLQDELSKNQAERAGLDVKLQKSKELSDNLKTEESRAAAAMQAQIDAMEARNAEMAEEETSLAEAQSLQKKNQASQAIFEAGKQFLKQQALRGIISAVVGNIWWVVLGVLFIILLFGALAVPYCVPVHPIDYAIDAAQFVAEASTNPVGLTIDLIKGKGYESPLRKIFSKFCKAAQLCGAGGNAATVGNGSSDTGAGLGSKCLSAPRSAGADDPYMRALARAYSELESGGNYKAVNEEGCYGRYQWCYFSRNNSDNAGAWGSSGFSKSPQEATESEQDIGYIKAYSALFSSYSTGEKDIKKALLASENKDDGLVKIFNDMCTQWSVGCGAGTQYAAQGKQGDLIAKYKSALVEEKAGKCGTAGQNDLKANSTVANNDKNISNLAYIQSLWGGAEVNAAELSAERQRLIKIYESGEVIDLAGADVNGLKLTNNGSYGSGFEDNEVKFLLNLYDNGIVWVGGPLNWERGYGSHGLGVGYDFWGLGRKDGQKIKGYDWDNRMNGGRGTGAIPQAGGNTADSKILRHVDIESPNKKIADDVFNIYKEVLDIAWSSGAVDVTTNSTTQVFGNNAFVAKLGPDYITKKANDETVASDHHHHLHIGLYPSAKKQYQTSGATVTSSSGGCNDPCGNSSSSTPTSNPQLSASGNDLLKKMADVFEQHEGGTAEDKRRASEPGYIPFNNPGNLVWSPEFAKVGAKASTPNSVNPNSFAIFPTYEVGRKELEKYLYDIIIYTEKYSAYKGSKTFGDIINKYAPPNENDTTNYINQFVAIGLKTDTPLAEIRTKLGVKTADTKNTNQFAFNSLWKEVEVNAAGRRPNSYKEIEDQPGYVDFLKEVSTEKGYVKYKDVGKNPEMEGKLNEMISASGNILVVNNTYRSFDDQVGTFFETIGVTNPIPDTQLWSKDLDANQLKSVRSAYLARMKVSAPPGWSQHSTGLAVDFSPVENTYKNTSGYTWLKTNANKYGFTLSYPDGSTAGAGYEPWHWAYESATAKLSSFAEGGAGGSVSGNQCVVSGGGTGECKFVSGSLSDDQKRKKIMEYYDAGKWRTQNIPTDINRIKDGFVDINIIDMMLVFVESGIPFELGSASFNNAGEGGHTGNSFHYVGLALDLVKIDSFDEDGFFGTDQRTYKNRPVDNERIRKITKVARATGVANQIIGPDVLVADKTVDFSGGHEEHLHIGVDPSSAKKVACGSAKSAAGVNNTSELIAYLYE